MKKSSKLGLVLKCLLIADALARFANHAMALWNMTNNYENHDEPEMVFEI